jgi:uncharacterized protein
MQIIVALPIGILFGLGILISGMSNPAKVLNFFDVAGNWDPSLALVMGSALMVTAIGYRLILRKDRPLLADRFSLPTSTRLDPALIGGSAVFGLGWGLTGICPGGLIPVLAIGRVEPLIFFVGLLAGLIATRVVRIRTAQPGVSAPLSRTTL